MVDCPLAQTKTDEYAREYRAEFRFHCTSEPDAQFLVSYFRRLVELAIKNKWQFNHATIIHIGCTVGIERPTAAAEGKNVALIGYTHSPLASDDLEAIANNVSAICKDITFECIISMHAEWQFTKTGFLERRNGN